MPIRSFLDLDVYQRAYKAAIIVHKEITPKLPENEKYDLKDQSSRASKAIPAIIAEGYSRKNHKRAWQSPSSSPHPDSRLTSHILTPLALSVPGYGQIQAPGVPNVGISPILQTAVTLLLVFAVLLTLFFLIYGGIRWIVSGGNKEKLQQARQTLTYSIIGLIVVLLSFFIINLIGGIFGVNLLNVPIPPLLEPCLPGKPC